MNHRNGKAGRRAVTVVGTPMVLLVLSGCLGASRAQLAPRSWVRTGGIPATQADVNACKRAGGLTWASLTMLDERLALFAGCMRDHGFKPK